MVSKQDIIKEIKDQLQTEIPNEDPDVAEWEERTGILLTINQAKKVLEIFKRDVKRSKNE